MGNKITLFLEREVAGVKEKKTIEFNLTPFSAGKKINEIRKSMKEGWKLVDCKGDNPKVVAFLKEQIRSYDLDPLGYKVPIKDTVKMGVDLAPKPKKGEIRKKLSIRKLLKGRKKHEQKR